MPLLINRPQNLTPLEDEIFDFAESSIEISLDDDTFERDNPTYADDPELQEDDIDCHADRFIDMAEDSGECSPQKIGALRRATKSLLHKMQAQL